LQRDTRGQELMNEVCQQLDLVEKDYFGLRFVDIEKQRVCLHSLFHQTLLFVIHRLTKPPLCYNT